MSASVFGLGGLLAACGGESSSTSSGTPASGGGGGELSWALSADPVNVAPFGVPLGPNQQAKEFMYDSLLEWDKDLKIQPALAESYDMPDARTYEFKLRSGATFHDGRPVTAADVVYSLELQSDPPPPGNDSQLGMYPIPDKIEAVDDSTVRVSYKQPEARLPGYLAWSRYSAIVPKGMYDEIDPRTEGIGTGPYKLVEYRTNSQVVYERFADYWGATPAGADRLTLKIMPDEQSRVAALRSGDIHGCDVSADIAKTLENDPNITVERGLTAGYRVLELTVRKGEPKPWHDRRVRQAINHAIDRRDVIDRVYSGNAEISGFVPPEYSFALSSDELESDLLAHDVDKARSLLAEAGVDGFTVELSVPAELADFVQIGQVIQQHLKEIGVDLKIQPIELGLFAENRAAGKFDFEINGKGMRGDIDGFMVDYDPDGPGYKVWFDGLKDLGPEIPNLIRQGRGEADEAKRADIYAEAQRLIIPQGLHLAICVPYKFQAMSKSLSGMYVSYTDFNPGLRTAQVST